jgi:hypothetical protein
MNSARLTTRSQGGENPNIFDALEVLKFIAGMPSAVKPMIGCNEKCCA